MYELLGRWSLPVRNGWLFSVCGTPEAAYVVGVDGRRGVVIRASIDGRIVKRRVRCCWSKYGDKYDEFLEKCTVLQNRLLFFTGRRVYYADLELKRYKSKRLKEGWGFNYADRGVLNLGDSVILVESPRCYISVRKLTSSLRIRKGKVVDAVGIGDEGYYVPGDSYGELVLAVDKEGKVYLLPYTDCIVDHIHKEVVVGEEPDLAEPYCTDEKGEWICEDDDVVEVTLPGDRYKLTACYDSDLNLLGEDSDTPPDDMVGYASWLCKREIVWASWEPIDAVDDRHCGCFEELGCGCFNPWEMSGVKPEDFKDVIPLCGYKKGDCEMEVVSSYASGRLYLLTVKVDEKLRRRLSSYIWNDVLHTVEVLNDIYDYGRGLNATFRLYAFKVREVRRTR